MVAVVELAGDDVEVVDEVRLGSFCPDQYRFAVRHQPVPNDNVWARSHLVSHWFPG
jgi:hypothetical protein